MRQTRLFEFDPLCKRIIGRLALPTPEHLRKMRWQAQRKKQKMVLAGNLVELMKRKRAIRDFVLSAHSAR